ncbi:toxic anion resistance protein [Falsibacillus pallidus]|uniref:Toxic anion resistance protein TelA n=1 Tax=Falsibacillus pallidus TaxID=493781 RepID=A0A370GHB5_9BACI|nr:toxic anion resistance protein [Falsibacillus pallidus]RDI43195.1 toxic anion resistance protein TelA [Falsibacillus pallidus]
MSEDSIIRSRLHAYSSELLTFLNSSRLRQVDKQLKQLIQTIEKADFKKLSAAGGIRGFFRIGRVKKSRSTFSNFKQLEVQIDKLHLHLEMISKNELINELERIEVLKVKYQKLLIELNDQSSSISEDESNWNQSILSEAFSQVLSMEASLNYYLKSVEKVIITTIPSWKKQFQAAMDLAVEAASFKEMNKIHSELLTDISILAYHEKN